MQILAISDVELNAEQVASISKALRWTDGRGNQINKTEFRAIIAQLQKRNLLVSQHYGQTRVAVAIHDLVVQDAIRTDWFDRIDKATQEMGPKRYSFNEIPGCDLRRAFYGNDVASFKAKLRLKENENIKLLDPFSRELFDCLDPVLRQLYLAEITRLRRACCHPRLVVDDCPIAGSKLELFSKTIDELLDNHHKVLVFRQYVDHLAILRECLDAKQVKYQYLDGSTPAKKRKQSVDAFQAGESDVFLISLKAGGWGLKLTAADYVIHMDPWWNPAVEDQASDRAHRMGQQRPVTIYRLIAAGTIEERITALHASKRDLAESLLEGTEISAKLSAEDLLKMIRS